VQVVSHGDGSPGTLKHPEAVELCRRVNDDLAEQVSQHPTRFRGFATLPLYDPVAAGDELRRCVVRDNVSDFLEQACLSEKDTHAIAHANAEALLRI